MRHFYHALAALLVTNAVAFGPDEWRTMIVYDIVPEACRQTVANNDVGDPSGDIYFTLKDMYLGVACASCKGSRFGCRGASTFDCNNPESTGALVVRKISIEVKQPYGTYTLCNVGNGSCDYSCKAMTRTPTPGVGQQYVCGGNRRTCNMAPTPSFWSGSQWDYWDYNAAVRLGRYTETRAGHSSAPRAALHQGGASAVGATNTTGGGQWFSLESQYENTYWRNATIIKIINAGCQRVGLLAAIQQRGEDCFKQCGPSGRTENMTDLCWVGCVYDTVLGTGSGTSTTPEPNGMSIADIEAAWLKGFASDDTSVAGCPPCPADGHCNPPAGLQASAARIMAAPRRLGP